jgi:hypothetical protein
MPRAQKITIREMRESGPTRLIVYCGDCKCAHSVVIGVSRGAFSEIILKRRNRKEVETFRAFVERRRLCPRSTSEMDCLARIAKIFP